MANTCLIYHRIVAQEFGCPWYADMLREHLRECEICRAENAAWAERASKTSHPDLTPAEIAAA